MELNSELKKRVEGEDWDYFAHMAHTFELEMEAGQIENAKLHKELQMVKKLIHAYLSTEKGRQRFLSTKFMVRMYRTIEGLDEKAARQEHAYGDFLAFLRALLHKMKKEKLVVYKTLEKTREFQRHKNFGEVL